jgi:dTDP-4-dehydrorhamnose reductase
MRFSSVEDQQGCPTFSPDLSEAVSRLIAGNHSGIFHVTNSGHCSWFEFARQILKAAGIRNVEVKPISSDKLMRPACRSPYGVLNNGKYSRVTGHTLRHWKDALDAYLKAVEH